MSNNSSSGGIGFFGLLGVVFIALKLMGIINWSWWLVLAPVYGPISVAIIILALYVIIKWK